MSEQAEREKLIERMKDFERNQRDINDQLGAEILWRARFDIVNLDMELTTLRSCITRLEAVERAAKKLGKDITFKAKVRFAGDYDEGSFIDSCVKLAAALSELEGES